MLHTNAQYWFKCKWPFQEVNVHSSVSFATIFLSDFLFSYISLLLISFKFSNYYILNDRSCLKLFRKLKKKIYLSFVPLCVLTLKCDRVGRETLTQMHILHSMFIAQCLHSLKQSETCQIGDLACMACLLTCWGSWQEGSLIYVCCYVFLSFFFQTENVVEEGQEGQEGQEGRFTGKCHTKTNTD